MAQADQMPISTILKERGLGWHALARIQHMGALGGYCCCD